MSPCAKPWILTHLYSSLDRRARSKTIAYPKTNPSCVRHSIWRRLISNLGTCRIVLRLVQIFTSERSERATITISKLYIYLLLPCIYYVLLPNFVSHFGHHIALDYVGTVRFTWNYWELIILIILQGPEFTQRRRADGQCNYSKCGVQGVWNCRHMCKRSGETLNAIFKH